MTFESDFHSDGIIRKAAAKTARRRLMLLAAIVLILCGTSAGLYAYHHGLAMKLESRVKRDGIAAADAGDDARAVSLLTQYLQSHGDDAEALAAYARVRLAAAAPGDGQAIDDTISALEQLLQLQTAAAGQTSTADSVRGRQRHRLLALCLDNNRPAQAIDVAGGILHDAPGDVAALAGNTTALMQIGDFEGALAAAQRWAAATPSDLHAQTTTFDLMQRLGKPGNEIAARAIALRRQHPGNAAFKLLESYALTLAGLSAEPDGAQPLTAVDLAKSAAAATPPKGDDSGDFIALLVKQLDELAMSDRSLEVLRREAKREPGLANCRNMARRLWELQRWPDVIAATGGKNPGDLPSDPELLALRGVAILNSDAGGMSSARSSNIAATLLPDLGRPRGKDATGLLAPIREALARQAGGASGAAWEAFFDEAAAPSEVHAAALVNRCQDPGAQSLTSPCLRYVLAIALAQLNERDLAIQQLQTVASQNVFWEAPAADEAELLLEQGRVDQALAIARLAEQRLTHREQALDQKLAIILARVWLAAIERGQTQTAGTASSLQQLVDAVQQTTPGECYTLAVEVALRLRAGETDAASEALSRALQSPRPIGEQTLAHLAQLSAGGGLHLQDACFARWQHDHGLTAELVLAQATAAPAAAPAGERMAPACRALIDGAPPPPGLTASPEGAGETADVQWEVARARYLDLIGDARGAAIWEQLGDAHPVDLHIQQLILHRPQSAAHAVAGDRALEDRAIDRLRTLTGEGCLNWRLARARFWIDDASAGSEEIEEGCRLLGAVLQTCPDCIEAYREMASGLGRLNNYDGAIQQLQAARNIDPTSPETVMQLVDLLEKRGQLSQAWLVLRPLTQGAHPNPAALLATGWLQEHDGDLASAADSYRRVLAIVPDSVAAENNLAMVLAKDPGGNSSRDAAGDLRLAADLARRAVAQHPESPDLYDTLAYVENKSNDLAAALRSIERAISLAPDDPRWHIRRAEILCGANRTQDARADIEAAQKAMDANRAADSDNSISQNELRQRIDALRVKLVSGSSQ